MVKDEIPKTGGLANLEPIAIADQWDCSTDKNATIDYTEKDVAACFEDSGTFSSCSPDGPENKFTESLDED